MNLSEAIQFTKDNRESWSTGKGARTAHINASHCERILGSNFPIEELSTKHFVHIQRDLKQEGKSPATINRVTAALSTVLTELRQNGITAPKVEYKRMKEPKGRPGFYTEEEVNSLLHWASTLKDYLLLHDSILFSIKTGCRQGELLKLRFSDIDFENNTITFRDVKTGESTGVQDHVIHLHPDLIPVLERRRTYTIQDEVFAWIGKDQLLRELRKVQAMAGITTDRCWHSLRHTTATWLLERDVPIRAVMGVLNHSNISTTLRYAKYTDRAIEAAINKI